MKHTILLVLVSILPVPSTTAQHAGAPRLLIGPASVRAHALGDAFVFDRRSGFSGGRDVASIFYHPGGLRGASGVSAVWHRVDEEASMAAIAASTAWKGGTLAAGLQVLSARTGALAVSMAYARSVLGLDAGIVARIVEQDGEDGRATAVAADVGLAHRAGPVTLALSGRNLGADLGLESGSVAMPWRAELGAASRSFEAGPLDLVLAAALSYGQDEEWLPRAGLEVSWWPVIGRTFAGRVGVRRVPYGSRSVFSFGLGFTGDGIALEYAWRPDRDIEGGHAVGISWR